MTMVYLSKYHPNFPVDPTGRDAPFDIGDTAICKNMSNPRWNGARVTIRSDLMLHDRAAEEARVSGIVKDALVYECEFDDGVHAVSIDRLHHVR